MKQFEIVKNGYSPVKVDQRLAEYAELLLDKDQEISKLKEYIKQLMPVLERVEVQKRKIDASLAQAQIEAELLKKQTEKQYAADIANLKLFQEKWRSYARRAVQELAPDQQERVINVDRKLQDILSVFEQYLSEKEYRQPDKTLAGGTFKPIRKMEKFLKAYAPAEAEKPVPQPAAYGQAQEIAETDDSEEIFDERDDILTEESVDAHYQDETAQEYEAEAEDTETEYSAETESDFEETIIKNGTQEDAYESASANDGATSDKNADSDGYYGEYAQAYNSNEPIILGAAADEPTEDAEAEAASEMDIDESAATETAECSDAETVAVEYTEAETEDYEAESGTEEYDTAESADGYGYGYYAEEDEESSENDADNIVLSADTFEEESNDDDSQGENSEYAVYDLEETSDGADENGLYDEDDESQTADEIPVILL